MSLSSYVNDKPSPSSGSEQTSIKSRHQKLNSSLNSIENSDIKWKEIKIYLRLKSSKRKSRSKNKELGSKHIKRRRRSD
jgi:hypothetical protein